MNWVIDEEWEEKRRYYYNIVYGSREQLAARVRKREKERRKQKRKCELAPKDYDLSEYLINGVIENPEKQFLWREFITNLSRKIPARNLLIVFRRHISSMTYAEIAKELNISITRVRQLLRRYEGQVKRRWVIWCYS